MKYRENAEFFQFMADHFKRDEEEREGIHVTDLLYCPLKAYYRKKFPEKNQDDYEGFLVKLIGTLAHQVLERIEGGEPEQKIEWEGIHGSIDLVLGDEIVEFKTTRKNVRRFEDVPETYVDQVRSYAALSGLRKAKLVIINVSHPLDSKIFDIEFDDVEISEWKIKLLERKLLLERALAAGDEKMLYPHAPRFEWECRYCEFSHMCGRRKG